MEFFLIPCLGSCLTNLSRVIRGTRTKALKNGLPAQVKLEVQIETEKAKARIYREAIKKLLKK